MTLKHLAQGCWPQSYHSSSGFFLTVLRKTQRNETGTGGFWYLGKCKLVHALLLGMLHAYPSTCYIWKHESKLFPSIWGTYHARPFAPSIWKLCKLYKPKSWAQKCLASSSVLKKASYLSTHNLSIASWVLDGIDHQEVTGHSSISTQVGYSAMSPVDKGVVLRIPLKIKWHLCKENLKVGIQGGMVNRWEHCSLCVCTLCVCVCV